MANKSKSGKREQIISPFKQVPIYGRFFITTLLSPSLIFFAILGNLCLGAGIYVFWVFEKAANPNVTTWIDALWWGMATVTTVGYGDIVPMTIPGKIAGLFLMVTGLILFISFSALMVTLFFSRAEQEILKSQKLTYAEFETIMAELKELKSKVEDLNSKH